MNGLHLQFKHNCTLRVDVSVYVRHWLHIRLFRATDSLVCAVPGSFFFFSIKVFSNFSLTSSDHEAL